jgi:hypothetical protein
MQQTVDKLKKIVYYSLNFNDRYSLNYYNDRS